MRLLPRSAVVGPWYVVLPVQVVLNAVLVAVVFWPYALVPGVPAHFGPLVNMIAYPPVLFLIQRRQIARRSGVSYDRCRLVLDRVRQGEPIDAVELAAVAGAMRPYLRSRGTRWVLAALPLVVAGFVLGRYGRHVTGGTIFAAGYAVAVAGVLYVLGTRRERRDRELIARLESAVAW